MTERRLQNTIALVVILTHLSVPIAILASFLAGGLSTSEFTTAMSMIMPMIGALSGLALTFVIRNKKSPKGRIKHEKVTPLYATIALAFPILFAMMIAALVGMKAYNFGITSFETFKLSLAAVETIFAAYTGKILVSLFEEVNPNGVTKPDSSDRHALRKPSESSGRTSAA